MQDLIEREKERTHMSQVEQLAFQLYKDSLRRQHERNYPALVKIIVA